jgi:D-glycero-alpha-D-manno-heptose 1-phosphate guanylyltransferase
MVTNADTWLESGIAEIKLEEVPSMAVIHVPYSGRYGSVQIDGTQINLFNEKSESTGSGWINAGLCHLVPSIFVNWDTKPFSMERVVFPTLAAGGTLKVVKIATEFIDIGIPSDYQKFCDLITLEHK